MMSMDTSSVVGIAVGVLFGVVFIVTCIISAVKAVKDRKRIKQRIAERERVKQEAKLITRRQKMMATSNIEDKHAMLAERYNNERNNASHTANGQPASSSSTSSCSYLKPAEPITYVTNNGVDNLTYAHSRTDMELHDSNYQTKSKARSGSCDNNDGQFPHKYLVPSKRTLSNDVFETKSNRQLVHLPPECLAVQKILRRHSYEVAVCEGSWMPLEPPKFASSRSIIQTYNFGDRSGCLSVSSGPGRTSTVGFVNRAYDKEDHRKT